MKRRFNFLIYPFVIVVFAAAIYGTYFVGKKLSYIFFYESFVQQTVKELVLESSLKELVD